jgi:hypothetical protein
MRQRKPVKKKPVYSAKAPSLEINGVPSPDTPGAQAKAAALIQSTLKPKNDK